MRAKELLMLRSLRLPLVASLLLVGGLSPLACGGGTPPPKDESDTAGSASASGDDSGASAATPADSSNAAPTASSAAASSGPTPAATTDSSGDIKAASGDDPWLAAHQMPPGDVMKTMKRAGAKVQGCWKDGLKRDPSTNGEVKIRLVITNEGKVRAWRDDGSSMSDEEVTQCIGGVVEKLKFPKQKSPGDAWGVYSIHFGG
jgi:hypothetical protein